MTIRHEPWPTGTPAWVELSVPDLDAARNFYGPLFGWDFEVGPPETGFYTTCLVDGERAVAIGGQMPGDENAPPPAWTTYLATADIGATVAAVTASGGTVLVPPMQILEFGTLAIFADPVGAVAGLWQSGTHTGADIVGEPGTIVWNEQNSRDLATSKEFYAAVFGYSYTDISSEGFDYATFELDGETRGGLGAFPDDAEDVPPNWLAYFGVPDTDAAVAYAVENGGAVIQPAEDTPYGRLAILQGPFGEVFALMQDITTSS